MGQKLMVNYNPDAPKERGFWYDAIISRKVGDVHFCMDPLTLTMRAIAGHHQGCRTISCAPSFCMT